MCARLQVPWADQPLVYYMKYRLYFQEFQAPTHKVAYDHTWGIGGATGEYDVPQHPLCASCGIDGCAPGTPVERCTHEVSAALLWIPHRFTSLLIAAHRFSSLLSSPQISGVLTLPGTMHFVAAHFHCHAPTCLMMEIYNNATGELICREEPYHGQGADVAPAADGVDRFDERGYIAQRVCMWGRPPLAPPPRVGGVPLFVRAVTNATYGHHGEMALPQMIVSDSGL